VLLGHSWYTADPSRPSSEHGSPSSSPHHPHSHHHTQIAQQQPQRALATQVLISISGETNTSDGTLEWSTPAGKPIDPTEDPYADDAPPFHAPSHSHHSTQQPHPARIGRCVGKQLYISDVDERKKRVEALVKISVTAQHGERMEEHVLGTFTSKPIKVISKPSKKRQSAKNLERERSFPLYCLCRILGACEQHLSLWVIYFFRGTCACHFNWQATLLRRHALPIRCSLLFRASVRSYFFASPHTTVVASRSRGCANNSSFRSLPRANTSIFVLY